MKRRSFPWTILILTFLVCAAGVGVMEYMRSTQQAINTDLDAQLKEANTKVSALRKREAALQQGRAEREALEPRLLQPADGQVDGQLLMTVVRAARTAGVKASPVTFGGGKSKTASAGDLGITFSVTGSEAQVLHFLRILEEGKPLAQIGTITWGMPVQKGMDPYANQGSVALEISFFADPSPKQPKQ